MKKTKPNILLWIMMSLITVAFTFGGYLLADNINLREASKTEAIEIPTKKYEASSMIYVSYDGVNDSSVSLSASDISSAKTLVETCSIIFRYSEKMLSVIPSGYSVSFTPVNESSVIKINVVGSNPEKCVQTANDLRDRAPEVFAQYCSVGECKALGYKATEATRVVNTIEIKPTEVSTILYAVIGFGIGAVLYVLMIIVDIFYRKKHNTIPISNSVQEANL